MRILGIIPARYQSSRFPGKPLADIAGKSMIQRVYEQCLKSQCLSQVLVATDDQRIADHVTSFGGHVQMTSDQHQSGTDRCAEITENYPQFDIFVNIQGDEPLIDPSQIDLLVSCFNQPNANIATLVKPIHTEEELFNENTPKVLLNINNEAIYFSRTCIPFLRGIAKEDWLKNYTFFKHIGIYAFKKATLKEITQIPTSTLELAEALEQLRWIQNGYKIQTAISHTESQAVDTPEDLDKLLSLLNKK